MTSVILPETRNDIFHIMEIEDISLFGECEPPEFLSEFFDLKALPSTDHRFRNAYDDIWQHTVGNPEDWPRDWLLKDERFELATVPDEVFLHLLCKFVHPTIRRDSNEARSIVGHINEQLKLNGWQLVETHCLAGRPVFAAQSIKEQGESAAQASSRIMISYVHESPERRMQVLSLCDRLRRDGVECHIDQYLENNPPRKGWPLWMADEIEKADFVVVICTEVYNRRLRKDEQPDTGLGGQWEGGLITQEIYNSGGANTKFIPVLLSPTDKRYIPAPLQSTTHYDLSDVSGYERLYRRLTRQPEVAAPPLGPRMVLPKK